MVPHMPLVSKLEELNLDHHVLVWINNYLANRHQRVTVNGATSESTRVTSGVPQGSVLGPLLFPIYDIVKVTLSEGSKLVLYADDILLYCPIHTNKDYSALQRDVDVISEWTNINSMQFNSAKCIFMLVFRRRNEYYSKSTLVLNGSPLESFPTFKYLGVLLPFDLIWFKHVQSICIKFHRKKKEHIARHARSIPGTPVILCTRS